jgi:hypothetical protein
VNNGVIGGHEVSKHTPYVVLSVVGGERSLYGYHGIVVKTVEYSVDIFPIYIAKIVLNGQLYQLIALQR